jgi:hypothetical protein
MTSTLILPTENCIDEETVKRALLNYEKVFIKHPDDRDFVNGNDVQSIASNAPGMSFGGAGLAKPLGKERDHDIKFEQLITKLKPAIDEGSLVIMAKPSDLYNNGLGMGYHIDDMHRYVYWNYRYMIANEDFIKAASRGIDKNWLVNNDYDTLAPTGVDDLSKHTDERLNDKVAYIGHCSSDEERKVLTRMIHARVASISRNLTLCHINNLVPFTTNVGYSSVIRQMQSNFSAIVTEANDGSIELYNLDLVGKIENLMFTDFLDQEKIKGLTTKETLKLRTKMWGKYGDSKIKLEEALLKMAVDSKDIKEYEKKVKESFEKFLKDNREYVHERMNLGIKIGCNFGALVSGTSLGPAVIQKFVSASSLEMLMTLACPMVFLLAEKRIPDIRKVLKQRNELKRLPGYDLYNFFKPLTK